MSIPVQKMVAFSEKCRKIYDKIVMKQVDAMASIGNAAAHCTVELNPLRVKQLRDDLVSFLARFSTI